MDSTIPVEQRLIKAIRILAPDKQQAVLDFAEFLQDRQRPGSASSSSNLATPSETERILGNDGPVSLEDHGIDVSQAAELRSRLQTFSEDWDRPEMAIYDDL